MDFLGLIEVDFKLLRREEMRFKKLCVLGAIINPILIIILSLFLLVVLIVGERSSYDGLRSLVEEKCLH